MQNIVLYLVVYRSDVRLYVLGAHDIEYVDLSNFEWGLKELKHTYKIRRKKGEINDSSNFTQGPLFTNMDYL